MHIRIIHYAKFTTILTN